MFMQDRTHHQASSPVLFELEAPVGACAGSQALTIDESCAAKFRPAATDLLRVAVVGARGYSGLELCRLLLNHPRVVLAATFNRDANWRLSDDLLECAPTPVKNFALDQLAELIPHFDVLFLATPAEVSQQIAQTLGPHLTPGRLRIIDLSGGFRLSRETYQRAYQTPHLAPQQEALYGLVPWQSPERLKISAVIANPGCYATSVLLALLPLVRAQLLALDWIVVDAKSGSSGAGRSAKESLLLSELFANFYPYKVGSHQHVPEIVHYLKEWSGQDVDLQMTTHLLPVERGLLSGIYARPNHKLVEQKLADADITQLIDQAYRAAYGHYPLVSIHAMDDADWAPRHLELKNVVGTPLVKIHYRVRDHRIYLFALIDNLLKGAAGQAVENLNLIYDWPITMGLSPASRRPL